MLLIVVKIVGKTRPYENNIRKESQLPMPICLNLPGWLGRVYLGF
jgi:hypothetical protein